MKYRKNAAWKGRPLKLSVTLPPKEGSIYGQTIRKDIADDEELEEHWAVWYPEYLEEVGEKKRERQAIIPPPPPAPEAEPPPPAPEAEPEPEVDPMAGTVHLDSPKVVPTGLEESTWEDQLGTNDEAVTRQVPTMTKGEAKERVAKKKKPPTRKTTRKTSKSSRKRTKKK